MPGFLRVFPPGFEGVLYKMANENWPVYGEISGPVVMIGFGSIGRGTLPLIERHFKFDKSRMTVIDPRDTDRKLLDERGIAFVQDAVTEKNYKKLLTPLLTNGGGQGFCVNLSVDTGSVDLMRLCRKLGVLYIDTVVEPWLGFYFDTEADNASRTNYALRESLLKEKHDNPGGATAISTCGANPGMVSWFVKQALVNLATDLGLEFSEPAQEDREGWAKLMKKAGVKGIHIAERDTQRTKKPKPMDVFWKAAIYLEQPGANTRVRSWCPTPGPQYGFLVTHNEAISIADFFTVRGKKGKVHYRPTCHYAYHPCNDAVLSMHEIFGAAGKPQAAYHVLDENELVDGVDELGVLLYGHDKNAYWYGSQLSLAEARKLAPYQNATGMQVTSAVLSGMVWALENPEAGIVEADEMDYKRCLEVQSPYLGPVKGYYTDWTPLDNRPGLFPEDLDENDPWQFRNILVR
jgi:homospermidine synthase